MISAPNPLCLSGHNASKFCAEENCKVPSPICDVEGCESQRRHEECMMKLESKTLLQKLMRKGESASKIQDQIISYYNTIIKALTRDKDEYIASNYNAGFQLAGNEKKLYELLRDGPSGAITPQLVLNVSKTLREQAVVKQNLPRNEFIKERMLKTEALLNEIKGLWKSPNIPIKEEDQQPDYKFFLDNRSSFEYVISQGSKTIKRTSADNKSYNYSIDKNLAFFAMIQPAISLSKSSTKITFKIEAPENDCEIYFGGCFKKIIESKFDCLIGLGGQAYLVGNDGDTLSHHKKEQNLKKNAFRCKTNDRVVLEYNPKTMQISVWNASNPKDKAVFDTQGVSNNNPLFACVVVYSLNLIVDIV